MACNYLLEWINSSYTNVNQQYVTGFNFNNGRVSANEADINLTSCPDEYHNDYSEFILYGHDLGNLSNSRQLKGGKLRVTNTLTENCSANLQWRSCIFRVLLTSNAIARATDNTTVNCNSSDLYIEINEPFVINNSYDSLNLISNDDIYIELPSGSEYYNLLEQKLRLYFANLGKTYDRFTYTPTPTIKVAGIIRNFKLSASDSCLVSGVFNYQCNCEDNCVDKRTSTSTQGVYITANWKDVLGNQFSEDYTLLFQPDSNTTSGIISMSSNNFKGLMGLKGVTCRFNQGVVRDSGYIKINGHITANKYSVDMLGNTLVPVFNDVTENFIIQFTFEPCCDYPIIMSETYSDALDALDIDSAELAMAQVDFDSIEWHGFALLTNYCCDNVSCNDGEEFIGNEEPIYKGVGGGGENVDITCICDNLALINTTLANKFDGLNGKMDSLIETIEDKELTVELDDCICENLESISDKLDSLDDIKDSIDNKVIPVTDVSGITTAINNKQIPVTDVSGITTAINNKQIPVTDVSGITTAINNKQIPVTDVSGITTAINNKQIPVTDVSGLNTSLGNIDSSLGQIDNTIAGGTASIGSSIDDLDISLGGINTSLGGIETSIDGVGSTIQNQSFNVDTTGLTCTDSQGNEVGLACILKNALNNRDNKGLADVIDDKDVTSYVDVAVEPYDMINIRRAFKDDDIQEG